MLFVATLCRAGLASAGGGSAPQSSVEAYAPRAGPVALSWCGLACGGTTPIGAIPPHRALALYKGSSLTDCNLQTV